MPATRIQAVLGIQSQDSWSRVRGKDRTRVAAAKMPGRLLVLGVGSEELLTCVQHETEFVVREFGQSDLSSK